MSHFTEMEVEFEQSNEKELIEALESQFGPGSIEIHDKPVGLKGYRGDLRSTKEKDNPDYAPPCHLVIRRKSVGSASNDIGYRRLENGKYAAYISEYDVRTNFSKAKQQNVAKEYTEKTSIKGLKKMGYKVQERIKQKDGTIKLIATKWG